MPELELCTCFMYTRCYPLTIYNYKNQINRKILLPQTIRLLYSAELFINNIAVNRYFVYYLYLHYPVISIIQFLSAILTNFINGDRMCVKNVNFSHFFIIENEKHQICVKILYDAFMAEKCLPEQNVRDKIAFLRNVDG